MTRKARRVDQNVKGPKFGNGLGRGREIGDVKDKRFRLVARGTDGFTYGAQCRRTARHTQDVGPGRGQSRSSPKTNARRRPSDNGATAIQTE